MWILVLDVVKSLWEQFMGQPVYYFNNYSIQHIIRCESTHFLFSAFMGWLGLRLMLIILSRKQSGCPDRYIFRISLLFGLVLSVTTHIFIDAFTDLA